MAYDYVVRLVDEELAQAAPIAPCWEVAIETVADAQALTVGLRAYSYDRREDAARAFQQARASPVDEVAAIGGNSLGVVLGELDRSGEEIPVYEDVVARFGDTNEPATRAGRDGADQHGLPAGGTGSLRRSDRCL